MCTHISRHNVHRTQLILGSMGTYLGSMSVEGADMNIHLSWSFLLLMLPTHFYPIVLWESPHRLPFCV